MIQKVTLFIALAGSLLISLAMGVPVAFAANQTAPTSNTLVTSAVLENAIGQAVMLSLQSVSNSLTNELMVWSGSKYTDIEGKIISISGSNWLVSDKHVGNFNLTVTPDTVYLNNPGTGSLVKIIYYKHLDGTLEAKFIKAVTQFSLPRETKETIAGKLISATSSSWVISVKHQGLVTVVSDSVTRVLNNPVVGDYVKVFGVTQPNGTFLAREFKAVTALP